MPSWATISETPDTFLRIAAYRRHIRERAQRSVPLCKTRRNASASTRQFQLEAWHDRNRASRSRSRGTSCGSAVRWAWSFGVTARDLLAKWVARRDELAALKATVDGATLCEDVLNDLEALAASRDQETVSLTEAAEITGYSRDHLSRLVRNGCIRNEGRKHRPLLAVGDLPLRPRAVAAATSKGYDPNTDARSLRVRR